MVENNKNHFDTSIIHSLFAIDQILWFSDFVTKHTSIRIKIFYSNTFMLYSLSVVLNEILSYRYCVELRTTESKNIYGRSRAGDGQ